MQSVGAPLSRWQSTQSLIFNVRTCFTFSMEPTSPWHVEHVSEAGTPSRSEKIC